MVFGTVGGYFCKGLFQENSLKTFTNRMNTGKIDK